MSLGHLRAALEAAGHMQAVLSHPQTVTSLGCFETPDEDWRSTPYCEQRLEEGMVLALEPAIYLPGWGGIRL